MDTAESSFIIPEYVNGKPTWVPYGGDIQRLLKEGDPTCGWTGDPRMYVCPRDGAEGYAVGRLNEDGSKSLICVSKAPHKLDKELLIQMRDHDTRYVDVYGELEKRNAARKKVHNDRFVAKTSEMIKRVAWGLKKDGLA